MDILFKNMIQAFIDKRSWFTDAGLPYPRYIDFYMGQPDNPEDFEFVLPAVFMNYSTTWKLAGKIYEGTPTIEFHCIPPDEFPSTANISLRQDDGLKTILWYQTVAQVLDTVSTDHTSRLIRANETITFTKDFKYHTMTYLSQIAALPGTERDKYVEGLINEVSVTSEIKSKYTL